MRYLWIIIMVVCITAVPAAALELEAPVVPDNGSAYMPDSDSNFADGLRQIFQKVISHIGTDIRSAVSVCLEIVCIVIIVTIVQTFHESVRNMANLVGAITVAVSLFFSTDAMIQLGADTISELSEYGKLLFPVLTAAMAAQGGITSSAAVYTGTMFFSSLLSTLVSRVFLPLVYSFLALAVAGCAMGEDYLKNMRDLLKQFLSWSLRILLTIFTTYISITGVVSGTTDAAALKATRVTISSFVPVVGGILSDASEAVLVGMSVAKNTAGIYGIFAILALFLEPFLHIGIHYLLLKAVVSACAIFGTKNICDLVNDFSTAMAMLLAMTGSVCVLLLIATVCFMKGAT